MTDKTTYNNYHIGYVYQAIGGAGGSGGGHGFVYWSFDGYSYTVYNSKGGSNGGDGEAATNTSFIYYYTQGTTAGAKGQGTTTKYFGESGGTLYSTGGDGGNTRYLGSTYYCYPSAGAANTGNGGGGMTGTEETNNFTSYKGGSGICIIRWSDQK
jgi:hypothetical protein